MIAEIPLIAIPAQRLAVILDNQECIIHVYTRGERLYMDLEAEGVTVFSGSLCCNRVNCKFAGYLPFKGGLYFVDNLGEEPPRYDGLGSRWSLLFVSEDETPPEGLRP